MTNHTIHKILSTMHAGDAYDFLCDVGREPWHPTKNHSRGELLIMVFDYAIECDKNFDNLNAWFEAAHA